MARKPRLCILGKASGNPCCPALNPVLDWGFYSQSRDGTTLWAMADRSGPEHEDRGLAREPRKGPWSATSPSLVGVRPRLVRVLAVLFPPAALNKTRLLWTRQKSPRTQRPDHRGAAGADRGRRRLPAPGRRGTSRRPPGAGRREPRAQADPPAPLPRSSLLPQRHRTHLRGSWNCSASRRKLPQPTPPGCGSTGTGTPGTPEANLQVSLQRSEEAAAFLQR